MAASSHFIAQARAQARAHQLATVGWWFQPMLPTDEGIEVVELSSGLRLPSPIVMRVDLAERPSLELRLEVLADKVVLTRLTVVRGDDERGLTASAVRDLPVKKVIDEAIRQVAMWSALGQEETGVTYRFLSVPGDGSVGLRPGVIGDRRRRLVNDELLTEVADIVRSNPVTPNAAVHKKMHTSTRNASRWIAEARRRGFLNEEGDNG